jgi:hypothetical protein
MLFMNLVYFYLYLFLSQIILYVIVCMTGTCSLSTFIIIIYKLGPVIYLGMVSNVSMKFIDMRKYSFKVMFEMFWGFFEVNLYFKKIVW